MAGYFGLSGELDIYLVAFVLIGFPLAIMLNALQTVFIARLASSQEQDGEPRLHGVAVVCVLPILALVLPIWLYLLPQVLPWIASGFPAEKIRALETALYWMTPYYFLNGLNQLGYGVLQAKRRYFWNGVLPAITPLLTLLILLAVAETGTWQLLAASLVAGMSMEAMLLLLLLRRFGALGLPRGSDWRAIRPLLTGSAALLPATLTGAVVLLVEQAIAASLGEGSNAALAYAYRLPTALQSLVVAAIGVTVLPYFSSLIAQRQHAYCLHSLNKLYILLGLGGLAIAFPLLFFSNEIIVLMYQRGTFDGSDVLRVVPVQTAYFAQLPAALLAILGMKALAATGRNTWVSTIAIAIGVLQCLLAYALAKRLGLAGIAWAATLASALVAATAYFASRASLGIPK